MRKWLTKSSGLKGSRGQTTAEYAIIVALVAVSSIAIITIFGDQVRELFREITIGIAGEKPDHINQYTAGGGDTAVNKTLGNF